MPGADSTKKNKAVKDRSGYVGLRTCTCNSYAVEQKASQAATWIYLASNSKLLPQLPLCTKLDIYHI